MKSTTTDNVLSFGFSAILQQSPAELTAYCDALLDQVTCESSLPLPPPTSALCVSSPSGMPLPISAKFWKPSFPTSTSFEPSSLSSCRSTNHTICLVLPALLDHGSSNNPVFVKALPSGVRRKPQADQFVSDVSIPILDPFLSFSRYPNNTCVAEAAVSEITRCFPSQPSSCAIPSISSITEIRVAVFLLSVTDRKCCRRSIKYVWVVGLYPNTRLVAEMTVCPPSSPVEHIFPGTRG